MDHTDLGPHRSSGGPPYTRPLSPSLMVYRWQYTMALSILNRLTGVALSAGLLLLVYWLAAAAYGEHSYARAHAVFAHPLTQALLVAFSFSFFFHLVNGVRHLAWDAGHGFEKKTARLSGWLTFLGSVALTVMFWVCLHVVRQRGAA